MIKNKLTKEISKKIYISASILIFLSFFIIPTIGLENNVEKFQCNGCSPFNDFLVFLIVMVAWSPFYGVFHLIFFAKDCREEEVSIFNLSKSYKKYLQNFGRNKMVQSISLSSLMIIVYLLIVRFFLMQLFNLFN